MASAEAAIGQTLLALGSALIQQSWRDPTATRIRWSSKR